ncbi:YqeB family protein [Brevibacillus daliensis]|uniref:YqeB family protein n=1 Tax=Brevibacillus daliensis TaxID=2892995 RepID=UPI001E4D3852|nr:hypothetical protein [Brevibacillus daliensis]
MMRQSYQNNKFSTVVGFSITTRILVLTIPPLLGIILGYFIPSISQWALTLPWIPFKKLAELLASIQGTWFILLPVLAGLLAGVWLSREIIRDGLVLTISNDMHSYLVASLWEDRLSHQMYVETTLPSLHKSSRVSSLTNKVTGHIIELNPKWTVI